MRPIEKKLDTLAKKLCKLLAGYKCYMGNHEGTDAHHIVSCNHKRQRWRQENLVCLCREHHDQAANENWTFGRDLDQRVRIWSLPELQDLERELKAKIKEVKGES